MLKQRICLIAGTILLLVHFGCRTVEQITPESTVTVPEPPTVPKVDPHIQPTPPQPPSTVKTTKALPETVKTAPQPKVDNSNVSLVKTGGSRFLSANNFVTRWSVYGPFKFKNNLKQHTTLANIIHHTFIDNEKNISGKSNNNQKLLPDDAYSKQFPGRVNLAKNYPGIEYAAAYAVAYLEIDQPISNLKLYSGSGGYIKIWLNGQLIHTYNRQNRDSHWDQDIIRGIKLKKGRNQVIVKSVTLTKPWSFYFRLTDKNGLPLTFTHPPK